MSLHPDFIKAVRRRHPTARIGIDIVVEDNLDGEGPHLSVWNWPSNPPTGAEIDEIMQVPIAAKTASDKLSKMLSQHGLTVDDLKQALKDKL